MRHHNSLLLSVVEWKTVNSPTAPCLCRHGDFFSAILKTQPQFLNDWQSRQWSKFFCLSVYVTMYLNDHQRSAFYESIGLNTTQFNQHVVIETNKTTARIFPEVPDCETEVRAWAWTAGALAKVKGC